jgi:hypothetical protein
MDHPVELNDFVETITLLIPNTNINENNSNEINVDDFVHNEKRYRKQSEKGAEYSSLLNRKKQKKNIEQNKEKNEGSLELCSSPKSMTSSLTKKQRITYYSSRKIVETTRSEEMKAAEKLVRFEKSASQTEEERIVNLEERRQAAASRSEEMKAAERLVRSETVASKREEQKAKQSLARKEKSASRSEIQKEDERLKRKKKAESKTEEQKEIEKEKRCARTIRLQFEEQKRIEAIAAAELLMDRTCKESVAYDANRFNTMMDSMTIFAECLVCGIEKSQSLMSTAKVSQTSIGVANQSIHDSLLPIYRTYSGNYNSIIDESSLNIYTISDITSSQSSNFSSNFFKPLQVEFDNQISDLISTGLFHDKVFASILYFEL